MIDPASVERTPAFVLDYEAFLHNLELLTGVQKETPFSLLLALKGFAMHAVFNEIAVCTAGATASSLNEARLASEFFNNVHVYAPVYMPQEFPRIAEIASHITFNSLNQYERYRHSMGKAQAGIRINPEYSTVTTDLYNPCTPGSRLGVRASDLATLPKGITGLHAHNLCEGGAEELAGTLENIERLFGHLLPNISWLNLGGGHLITKKGYNIELLQQTLRAFHARHPHIEIILEPGAAFVWETGFLIATVLDIVENQGVTTAMLDTSFATHMPDCLEMPYTPRVQGAVVTDDISTEHNSHRFRLGGASCLAGDWVGDYLFPAPLKIGDRVVFEDMMHYTMVKTTTFNGIALADIGISNGGGYELVKRFSYEDYRNRLS